MEQRVYHGQIDPDGLVDALLDEWDRGETIAQALNTEDGLLVQIGQREAGWFGDEPRQALTLGVEQAGDGVRVTMGQQQWYKHQGGQIMVGGLIGFFPFFFTWPLGGDDAPIDSSLPGQVWQSVERYVAQHGAATGETRRLATSTCPRCGVANPRGAQFCSACGTSLQAAACAQCGLANPPEANFCMRCGARLQSGEGGVDETAR